MASNRDIPQEPPQPPPTPERTFKRSELKYSKESPSKTTTLDPGDPQFSPVPKPFTPGGLDPGIPFPEIPQVSYPQTGCTDSNAENYNSGAPQEDGTCIYHYNVNPELGNGVTLASCPGIVHSSQPANYSLDVEEPGYLLVARLNNEQLYHYKDPIGSADIYCELCKGHEGGGIPMSTRLLLHQTEDSGGNYNYEGLDVPIHFATGHVTTYSFSYHEPGFYPNPSHPLYVATSIRCFATKYAKKSFIAWLEYSNNVVPPYWGCCTTPGYCNYSEAAVEAGYNCPDTLGYEYCFSAIEACEASGALFPNIYGDLYDDTPFHGDCNEPWVTEEFCLWDDGSFLWLSDTGWIPTYMDPSGEGVVGDNVDADGNWYSTVWIGTHRWMAQNLKTTHYRNGDPIHPNGLDEPADDYLFHETNQGAYGEHPDVDLNIQGRLYNWFAVMDERGICPEGYHVPTIEEWLDLRDYIESDGYPGAEANALKEASCDYWQHWAGDCPEEQGIDVYGFTALPTGYRHRGHSSTGYASYNGSGHAVSYLWSSSERPYPPYTNAAYNVEMASDLAGFEHPSSGDQHDPIWTSSAQQMGYSVRCKSDIY